MSERTSVLVIGAGINGNSVAWHLRAAGFADDILVCDHRGIGQAATSIAVGGFRNLRSHPLSLAMMNHACAFFADLHAKGVDFGYQRFGYLIALGPAAWARREETAAFFRANGVRVAFYPVEEARERYLPGYRGEVVQDRELAAEVADLLREAGLGNLGAALASTEFDNARANALIHSLGDPSLGRAVDSLRFRPVAGFLHGLDCGVLNPFDVGNWFASEARAKGVRYRLKASDAVERILIENGTAKGALLRGGEEVRADRVVLCAGAESIDILQRSGISVSILPPVRPLKRQLFTTTTFPGWERREGVPFTVIDPNNVYFKHEGPVLVWGRAMEVDPGMDTTPDPGFFGDFVFPTVEARFAGARAIRLQPENTLAGVYDENLFDHNTIAGPNPFVGNLYDLYGCSGHGAMESPATGRGIAEHVMHGRYVTLDLSPLSAMRIWEGRPMEERIRF